MLDGRRWCRAPSRDQGGAGPPLAYAWPMRTPSPARLRAFVLANTRPTAVLDAPGVRLHLADDVTRVMALAGRELGQPDPPLPFWAFAWAGGLALARYLAEHPEEVAGRRVIDVATGSGLCAIVASRAGAGSVLAVDIDPLAEAAVTLNSRVNGARIGFVRRDLLGDPPPPCQVLLAGDVCYEATMSGRMLGWLREAARGGVRVLLGDPGRAYLPPDLERLATYRVHTSRELEADDVRASAVYTIRAGT
jgi:predicted nicotinamide N-methyase